MEVDTLRMSCPYCKNHSICSASWYGGWFDICLDCGAITPYPSSTPEESKKLWNSGEIVTNEEFFTTQEVLKPCPFCGAEYCITDDEDCFLTIDHKHNCFFNLLGERYMTTRIQKNFRPGIDAWNRRAK